MSYYQAREQGEIGLDNFGPSYNQHSYNRYKNMVIKKTLNTGAVAN